MGKRRAEPNGKFQAVLQIKECNRTMLILCADDALRGKTESIPIKPQRSFQIVYTDSNHGDSWFHIFTTAPLRRIENKKIETGYVLEREVSTFRDGTLHAVKHSRRVCYDLLST